MYLEIFHEIMPSYNITWTPYPLISSPEAHFYYILRLFCFPSFFNKSLSRQQTTNISVVFFPPVCWTRRAACGDFSVGSWRNSICFWIICEGWRNLARESLFNNGWFSRVNHAPLPQSYGAEFKPRHFIRSVPQTL